MWRMTSILHRFNLLLHFAEHKEGNVQAKPVSKVFRMRWVLGLHCQSNPRSGWQGKRCGRNNFDNHAGPLRPGHLSKSLHAIYLGSSFTQLESQTQHYTELLQVHQATIWIFTQPDCHHSCFDSQLYHKCNWDQLTTTIWKSRLAHLAVSRQQAVREEEGRMWDQVVHYLAQVWG